MSPRSIGLLVGAAFGVLFVLLNAGSPLNAALSWVLRGLAVAAFAVLVVVLVRARGAGEARSGAMFGAGYRWVVAGEAVLLFGGIAVLRLLGAAEQASVAWIAFVVGAHFVALAVVWRERGVRLLGAALTVLGVAGLVLAATPAVAWVPLVSGVLSGFVLLGGSLAVAAGVSVS